RAGRGEAAHPGPPLRRRQNLRAGRSETDVRRDGVGRGVGDVWVLESGLFCECLIIIDLMTIITTLGGGFNRVALGIRYEGQAEHQKFTTKTRAHSKGVVSTSRRFLYNSPNV